MQDQRVYLSLYILHHVATGEFGGDDAANERRGTETAAEEDTFDAVTSADELRRLYEVLHDVFQQRSRQVFALKLACNKVNYNHTGQNYSTNSRALRVTATPILNLLFG